MTGEIPSSNETRNFDFHEWRQSVENLAWQALEAGDGLYCADWLRRVADSLDKMVAERITSPDQPNN